MESGSTIVPQTEPVPPAVPPVPPKRVWGWIVVLLLVLIVGGVIGWQLSEQQNSAVNPTKSPAVAVSNSAGEGASPAVNNSVANVSVPQVAVPATPKLQTLTWDSAYLYDPSRDPGYFYSVSYPSDCAATKPIAADPTQRASWPTPASVVCNLGGTKIEISLATFYSLNRDDATSALTYNLYSPAEKLLSHTTVASDALVTKASYTIQYNRDAIERTEGGATSWWVFYYPTLSPHFGTNASNNTNAYVIAVQVSGAPTAAQLQYIDTIVQSYGGYTDKALSQRIILTK